jgi:hypothetical protein
MAWIAQSSAHGRPLNQLISTTAGMDDGSRRHKETLVQTPRIAASRPSHGVLHYGSFFVAFPISPAVNGHT